MSCEGWSRKAAKVRGLLVDARDAERRSSPGSEVDKLRARLRSLDLELQLALCERNYWWEVSGMPRSPLDLD